ncbi:hypothetical protein BDN72DRAFT_550727 [Pluteus cervinus]|uniref:Uncharacterized protein n=1 Tax=Pluteus cervinus TaxID=181527 RepID=A0ACD3AWZ1_9AGAR|nr:hypothetical protein BDN72DRAFT_550727 [Pluteus cervinus]
MQLVVQRLSTLNLHSRRNLRVPSAGLISLIAAWVTGHRWQMSLMKIPVYDVVDVDGERLHITTKWDNANPMDHHRPVLGSMEEK